MLTQKALQIHGDLGTARLLPAVSTMHLLKPKSIYTTAHCKSTVEVTQPLGRIERMLKKIGLLDVQKYVITVSPYIRFLFYYFKTKIVRLVHVRYALLLQNDKNVSNLD